MMYIDILKQIDSKLNTYILYQNTIKELNRDNTFVEEYEDNYIINSYGVNDEEIEYYTDLCNDIEVSINNSLEELDELLKEFWKSDNLRKEKFKDLLDNWNILERLKKDDDLFYISNIADDYIPVWSL